MNDNIDKKMIYEGCLFSYEETFPKIEENVFVAPGVKIIGDVEIKKGSSVWYNTVVRGDVHYIKIGEYTNVQDCSMLHVTNDEFPLTIGNRITIGHSVTLHGCTLKDETLIGMGAVILDGATVGPNCLVAAGTVITPDFVVPKGTLIAGIPGKVIRDLRENEIEDIKISSASYFEYAKKSWKSLLKKN